jgi:hypothetical protein
MCSRQDQGRSTCRNPTRIRNHLLAALPASELERLRPHLDPVSLPLKKVLITAGEPIPHAYFPEAGVGSLIARWLDLLKGLARIGQRIAQ